MDDTISAKAATENRLYELSTSISNERQLQKQCDTYRSCRSVIEKGKTSKNPTQYKSKNAKYYELHKTLKENLERTGITKIPSTAHFQKKIKKLEREYSSAEHEFKVLSNKILTLKIINNNFNQLITDVSSRKDIKINPINLQI